jgi:hypothetical protein
LGRLPVILAERRPGWIGFIHEAQGAAPQAGEAAEGALPGAHLAADMPGLPDPDLAGRNSGANRLQRPLKFRCIVQ